MTGPKSASVNVLTNIMSDWEPKTTFGRYFLEIIVQGSEISKAHGVICFWTEPLLYLRCWCFFVRNLSFEMYGVVTRFFLKSPLSQTLEETQLSRLLITDSVRWTVFSDVEFSTTKVFLRYFTSTSWPKKETLVRNMSCFLYLWLESPNSCD